jgi:hypothetical protein
MAAPRLPSPPTEWDRQYFNLFIQTLTTYFNTLDNPGNLRGATLQLAGYANASSTTQALVLPISTNLTLALTNVDTTITVTSTTNFPTSGVITIENEKINYTGITSVTFTGCTRGQYGTTAASHALNTAVVDSGATGTVYRDPITSDLKIVP